MAEQTKVEVPSGKEVTGVVQRCRSCFRDDLHFYVKIPQFSLGFLLIATGGLILFLRPTRCITCGKVRIF